MKTHRSLRDACLTYRDRLSADGFPYFLVGVLRPPGDLVSLQVVADVWEKGVWDSTPSLGAQVLAVFSFIFWEKRSSIISGKTPEVPDILQPDICGLLIPLLTSVSRVRLKFAMRSSEWNGCHVCVTSL